MPILGRLAILQGIDQGDISITPYSPELEGLASVDLTLASTFRVFRKVHQIIEVRADTDYRTITDKVEVANGKQRWRRKIEQPVK
jgi:dCTP deaminase